MGMMGMMMMMIDDDGWGVDTNALSFAAHLFLHLHN